MVRETSYPAGDPAMVGPDVDVVRAVRRISWGAVFGGVVLALAINLLLGLLGIAIGATTIDPLQVGGTPSLSAFGIGAGIWWIISTMIALFVGGYAASRMAGVTHSMDALLQSLIAWGLATLITVYLLTTVVGSMVGGAFSALGTATTSVAQGVAQGAQPAARAAGQLSADEMARALDQLLARVLPEANEREVAEARQRLGALIGQVVQGGQTAQQARREAQQIIQNLTGLSPAEAEQRIEQAAQQVQFRVLGAAETAASTVATAAFWSFIAILLGAVTAGLGGWLGRRPRDRLAIATDAHA